VWCEVRSAAQDITYHLLSFAVLLSLYYLQQQQDKIFCRPTIFCNRSSMSLVGKLALVTGSTSGIGLGVAKSLAAQGANLVINGFGNPQEIEKLVKDLSDQYKVNVDYDGADLSKAADIERMMNAINKKKPLDVLINNAGIQFTAPVEAFPVEKWNAVLDINLSAVFHTTRLALPAMKQQNWGRIINIASVHGLVASVEKSAYVASKHAVLGFTKVVALENARTGVTANCICPGWVLTPLVQKQIEDRAANLKISYEEAKFKLLTEKQPSGGFVTPEQLGDLATFLCSNSATEVRGVAWQMDGGWTAQ
jgi:3-hydroxybutyrate dehydrogenase